MSEVHRYKVQCMFSEGGSKIEYFPHGPSIVMAEAFDAQRLRADTVEAELKDLRVLSADQGLNLKRVKREFDSMKNRAEAAELLIGELRELLNIVRDDTGEYYSDNLQSRILAALNPNPEAESHE